MITDLKVGLVGAGSMGGALFKCWLSSGILDHANSAVIDPGITPEMEALCNDNGVKVNPDIDGIKAEIIVIAVKPQLADKVLPAYSKIAAERAFLSVMAGTSIALLEDILGPNARTIRAMPNLPAAIGEGMAGLFASKSASARDRDLAEALMNAAGASVWVREEQQIDMVTAISGSGPAYIFLLTEALMEAGENLGLPAETAESLARQMVIGAGAYLKSEKASAADLRNAVTSPGGTTAAAIKIFDGDDKALRKLVDEAVKAAFKRAGELRN